MIDLTLFKDCENTHPELLKPIQDEFIKNCRLIMDPLSNDINIEYFIRFNRNSLEIEVLSRSLRFTTSISCLTLANVNEPYQIIRLEISNLMNTLVNKNLTENDI